MYLLSKIAPDSALFSLYRSSDSKPVVTPKDLCKIASLALVIISTLTVYKVGALKAVPQWAAITVLSVEIGSWILPTLIKGIKNSIDRPSNSLRESWNLPLVE